MKYYEIVCVIYIFYELVTYNPTVIDNLLDNLMNPPLCKY